METMTEKELQETASPQQTTTKVWLWPLAVGGICLVLSCVIGSGWFFWQNYAQQGEAQETALDSSSQGDQEVETMVLAATPTLIPTSSASSTSVPAIPTEPGGVVSTCANEVSIDSPAATAPTVGAISFATRHDQNGWPVDNALQFTSTVTTVLASFNYDGMRDGLNWERVWYFGDQEMSRGSGTWDAGSRGQLTVQVTNKEGGFIPGSYKLELYTEGQLLGQNSFSIMAADTPAQQPIQVVYTTWDGQKHGLNLLNLETQQTEPLNEFGRWPTWSSDAVGLIFYGESDSAPGLRVLNMAQRKSYQLNQEAFFQSLAWSPNRTYVASAATDEAGSHLVLWHLDQNQAYAGPPGEDPAWSPEGRRLVYRSCSEAGWHISTIQVIGPIFDTTSIRRLTMGDDSQPAWSANGQRIAFVRREGDNQDIYTVSPDGSNLLRLTDQPGADTAPAWTPDHRLLFRSFREGQWGIFSMNADGSDQRRLITTPAQPNWQPDRLAVSTNAPLVKATATPPTQPQAQIPPGQGLLAVSNQQNNDEMTFTIDNREHKIGPFQVRMIPLNPGHYTWTASWPGKNSRTGIADIALGQIAYPVVER